MVTIKKYEPKYFDDVRQVCINTGPLEARTDPNTRDFILFTFCDYYCEQEPENAFVLVDENDVAQGYVFGATNFWTYIKKIKPYLAKVKKLGKEYYRDALGEIIGHGIYSLKYPSHLHIDINAPFRGNGNGSRMISTLTEHMKNNMGVKSIMLIVGTSNVRGINFYKKNGFKVICALKNTGTVMAKEL
ncbi:MAG: GNAT family N-acetyltransferase [Clostridia bacterium]|nr:GNAT family N-acetyltransferase [Clostridia bacterium]